MQCDLLSLATALSLNVSRFENDEETCSEPDPENIIETVDIQHDQIGALTPQFLHDESLLSSYLTNTKQSEGSLRIL